MASSASREQWSFTGGKFKYAEISEFFIDLASSTDIPFNNSVA